MDKIIASLVAAGVVALGLLASRSASASQSVNPDQADFVPPSGPLGLRNKNPFNLKFANIGWRGEIGTDGTFSVFDTSLNGLRAGMKNIHTKFSRDGANTVRKLMTILSPEFENPLEEFINFVALRINVAPDQPLRFEAVILPLSKAIVTFETGVPNGGFSNDLYERALQETGL